MSRPLPTEHALLPQVSGRDAIAHERDAAPRRAEPVRTHNATDDSATIHRPLATLSPDHAGLAAARDHAILAAALDPIITIDSAGTIHFASDSVQRVFGWPPQELVGHNINVLMPEPDRTNHDGYLAGNGRTEHTNIIGCAREVQAVRKSGERFPIELCVSRVDYSPQEASLPLFVGIIRDITQRKRLEGELEQYQRLLEQKVQDRTNARDRMTRQPVAITLIPGAAGRGAPPSN